MTTVRKTVAGLIALVLILGLVTALGYMILGALDGHQASVPEWTEKEDATYMAERREALRVIMRKRVPPAQIPWVLDLKNPELALVAAASHPWVRGMPAPGEGAAAIAAMALPTFPTRVAPDEPAAASLPAAQLPTFRARVAVDEPASLILSGAAVPWKVQSPGDVPVALPPAYLPHLRRKRDSEKPDPTNLLVSQVPWVRTATEIAPIQVNRAHLPAIQPRRDVEPAPAPLTRPATTQAAATGPVTSRPAATQPEKAKIP